MGAKNNSTGGSDVTGIVIGTVVPVVSVLVFVLLAALVLCAFLIFRVTRRRKEEWCVVSPLSFALFVRNAKNAHGRPLRRDVNFDELEIGNLLGEGSFGEVYKGLWKGTEVAVKVMTPGLVSREMQHSFVAEMRVMSALRHPNVVLFMGASSKPPRQCIIMEYMALGSLYDVRYPPHTSIMRCLSSLIVGRRPAGLAQRPGAVDPDDALAKDRAARGQGHALPPLVGHRPPRPQVAQPAPRLQVERQGLRLWYAAAMLLRHAGSSGLA